MNLKRLLKRGALLAAANWPAVAIQFVAETTFQVLLAVPVIGAAILVAVLLGGDLAELLQGSLRDIFTTVSSALMSEPAALVAFVAAFAMVLLGGSFLMFLVKGGTVDVLIAAHGAAGPIESEPITFETFHTAMTFTVSRFRAGCARLSRRYLWLGLVLMAMYGLSGAAYLMVVAYGYRESAILGGTFLAALASILLVVWITIVNLLYLLTQIAIAVDDVGLADGFLAILKFIRAEFRELLAVAGVVFALVIGATLVSALAWSGVGLIAFVPLVGLAVIPLQLAALLVRGLVFEYLGLTALGAYVTLYIDYVSKRSEVRRSATDVAHDLSPAGQI